MPYPSELSVWEDSEESLAAYLDTCDFCIRFPAHKLLKGKSAIPEERHDEWIGETKRLELSIYSFKMYREYDSRKFSRIAWLYSK